MSYNVDTWKTKELAGLKIPVASLFKSDRADWHPQNINHDDGSMTFAVFNDTAFIKGTVANGILTVSEIVAHGEGSGSACHYIIEPALADSTGKLVAVRVWECGDSIDRLTVEDGKVTSEAIEL